MDSSIAQNLQTYITAELNDTRYYRQLADRAPNEDDRKLLMEISSDEQQHAVRFQKLYRAITGKDFTPEVPPPELNGSYKDLLRDRVLDEAHDFRKYGEQHLKNSNDLALSDAYYLTQNDENVHALRLLYMLSK